MHKKLLKTFIVFIFLSLFNFKVNAQSIILSDYKYKMVTTYSDQDPLVYVSRFTNTNDDSLTAFCLQPHVAYSSNKEYEKQLNDNEYIFNLVKAYDTHFKQIEEKNEYYIATQILIWKEVSGIDYTFKEKDYQEYKDEILEYIKTFTNIPNMVTIDTLDCHLLEEYIIEKDFSDYDIYCDGIEILEKSNDLLKFKVIDLEPINKEIKLVNKYNPLDYSYTYISEVSQDLYVFEGDYDIKDTLRIEINTLDKKYININYSKIDTNNNPIKDAQFKLYEINSEDSDEELIFIHTNTDINIYELLSIDTSSYEYLDIKVSERYLKYVDNNIINTNELGYFECFIYDGYNLIKQAKVYVSDDILQTNNYYRVIDVKEVYSGFSFDVSVNVINNVLKGKDYYLCESEPNKGYEYLHKPCKFISSDYDNEVIEFVNNKRNFTLRLMKHNRDDIYLNNAKFIISYLYDDNEYSNTYATGALNIQRYDDNKYLIYKHIDDEECKIIEFKDDYYCLENAKIGDYLYYQSNSDVIDDSKLINNTKVIKGGFIIDDLPYSSTFNVEEIVAPSGYMITEASYQINADLNYSELTYTNYRVNEFNILPKKVHKIPKTCIDG